MTDSKSSPKYATFTSGTCAVCHVEVLLSRSGKLAPHTTDGEPRPFRTVDACDGSDDYPDRVFRDGKRLGPARLVGYVGDVTKEG